MKEVYIPSRLNKRKGKKLTGKGKGEMGCK